MQRSRLLNCQHDKYYLGNMKTIVNICAVEKQFNYVSAFPVCYLESRL